LGSQKGSHKSLNVQDAIRPTHRALKLKVDHLYVLLMLASLGDGEDTKLETLGTAKALYARHGGKAKTAALVKIWDVSGTEFKSEVLETRGDNVPLGVGIEKKSPEKDKPTSTLDDKGLEGKKEQVSSKTSAVLYLVFHSDGSGMAFLPKEVANLVTTVVPKSLHPSITKISLFACCVADKGYGTVSIKDIIGLTMDDARKKKTIGGLSLMVSLLGDLASLGIRPMICGYDIPIFAGEGPYKQGQPSLDIKTLADNEWKKAKSTNPDIYGRKLVRYDDKRQSLTTLKNKGQEYKMLHKKVLRLNDQGQIANELAGRSSKD
jgi:hypothetical protein